jgi:phosphate transport system substrate-binding protein
MEGFAMVTFRTLAITTAALGALSLAGCGGAEDASRDQVRAVGSSTVYPFAKAVAEQLAKATPASSRRSSNRPARARA